MILLHPTESIKERATKMKEKEMIEYIELQRKFIMISLKRGHTMEELEALKNIEKFEARLECNAETEVLINNKFHKLKTN